MAEKKSQVPNFKVEGKTDHGQFEYHIGGYTSPFGTARDVTFEITKKKKKQIDIQVDLISFLDNLNTRDTPSLLTPGQTAANFSDLFQSIFHLDE